MPNINDINGVTVANLAKLDAILKANISKVNGLTLAAAFTGLLDTYTGAAAGYSTRRLASSATNLMRIRRASDDAETDIGFDSNGDLDTAAIASHCGASAGYCVTWVDQSGNGNNATQSTAGNQPQIYNGTAVITENGKPALDFPNPGALENTTLSASSSDKVSMFSVAAITGGSLGFMMHTSESDGYRLPIARSGNSNAPADGVSSLSFFKDGSSATVTTRAQCYSEYVDSTQHLMTIFGTLSTAITSGNTNAFGGRATADTAYPVNGPIQELIIYYGATDQSSNRTGIETDINSDYLIYQPTDAPTSGLLATYTGAAAAYSVRQLSDKAVIAMRIRRDSDDEERNIGFDTNGDLATADISAFCGTANGYVTRWWDQSTNGNHADQATDTSQPQIYNGTSVLTENGKPAVTRNASGGAGMNVTSAFSGTTLSVFCTTTAQTTERRLQMSGFFFEGNRMFQGSAGFTSSTSTTQQLNSVFFKTTDEYYIDGSSVFSGNAGNNSAGAAIIMGQTATARTVESMQEMIIYESDQSSNRTGIDTDINGYFSIY